MQISQIDSKLQWYGSESRLESSAHEAGFLYASLNRADGIRLDALRANMQREFGSGVHRLIRNLVLEKVTY